MRKKGSWSPFISRQSAFWTGFAFGAATAIAGWRGSIEVVMVVFMYWVVDKE